MTEQSHPPTGLETPKDLEIPTGLGTMSPAMGQMRAYPRYLFDKLRPWLGKRILEIGVGHGTYTQWLLEVGDVLATDIDQACLAEVSHRFSTPRLRTTRIDLNEVSSIAACADFAPDTIVCINVLEHIADDRTALAVLCEITAVGGHLGLIVPAHPRLLGKMDREAGHFRRYNRQALSMLLAHAGWQVLSVKYINVAGAMGWWFHNRLRRDAGLADRSVNAQMRRADDWLPRLANWTDPLLQHCAGLSLVAIARRPAAGGDS